MEKRLQKEPLFVVRNRLLPIKDFLCKVTNVSQPLDLLYRLNKHIKSFTGGLDMNITGKSLAVLFVFCTLFLFTQSADAQRAGRRAAAANESYTGNAISFNGPRTATAFFNLRINGQTSDEQARQFLNTLKRDGQRELLDDIRNEDLGSFSVGNQIGRRLNVVRESTVDGKRRIFIVFERWTQLAEIRGGYRSVDYPFGVIELFIDERTGRGEGTYIAAAKIRWDEDSGNNLQQVEIENFATYPVKLTNVRLEGGRRRL